MVIHVADLFDFFITNEALVSRELTAIAGWLYFLVVRLQLFTLIFKSHIEDGVWRILGLG